MWRRSGSSSSSLLVVKNWWTTTRLRSSSTPLGVKVVIHLRHQRIQSQPQTTSLGVRSWNLRSFHSSLPSSLTTTTITTTTSGHNQTVTNIMDDGTLPIKESESIDVAPPTHNSHGDDAVGSNDGADDNNKNSNKRNKPDEYHKHSNRKAKRQPNPRRDKRMKLMDGGDEDETAVATINKGSLAYPDMQQPQFGFVPDEEENAAVGDEVDESNQNTVKRRVALVLGFLGSRYHGFQMQPQRPTLQAILEYALYRAKFVSQANFGVPFKYGWSHSARTDRGVHAAAHVCSCKLEVPAFTATPTTTTTTPTITPTDDKGTIPSAQDDAIFKSAIKKEQQKQQDQQQQEEDEWYDTVIRGQINSYLPDDIRIFQIVRTTRNFCAKNARDQVRYQYWFPSFMLMPQFDEFWKTHFDNHVTTSSISNNTKHDNNNKATGTTTTTTASSTTTTTTSSSSSSSSLPTPTLEQWHKFRSLVQDFRVADEQMQTLEQAMRTYQGTHSFHNFTKGMESGKAQALRYIIECQVQKKYMAVVPTTAAHGGDDGDDNTEQEPDVVMMEWISADIVGQSFLLNQIRKMISMAVDVARGKAPLSTLSRMLERQRKTNITSTGDSNISSSSGSTNLPLFRVGVAPAQGLFLDLSYYNSYNRKCKNLKLQPLLDEWAERERQEATAGTTTATTTTSSTKADDGFHRWQTFKNKVILPHLVREEWEQGNFLKYLVQQEYAFDHVTYYQLGHINDETKEQPQAQVASATVE